MRNGAPEIGDPLDFILADHKRQFLLCEELNRLAENLDTHDVATRASELLEFLETELPLHIQDEECTLFPMLKDRCGNEEGLSGILSQLSKEHELDEDLVDFLKDDLKVLVAGRDIPNPTRLFINLREFTETQRRHLDMENRTVMVLARKRFSPEDLLHLANEMRKRRAG